MKRLFDIAFSLLGIILLSPVFFILSILVLFSSRGNIFFLQERIGKNLKPFKIIKFRSMYSTQKIGTHVTGYNDPRVTPLGRFLRKTKLDEIPQLFNILTGKMSFVGPRPESVKYLNKINEKDRIIFSVRPGLTDFATLVFSQEERLFKGKENIEEYYVNTLLPRKIKLCLKYIHERSMLVDIKIILETLRKILTRR